MWPRLCEVVVFFTVQLVLWPTSLALSNDKCKYCLLIVETFKTGMKRTENQHFAGGNTAWEEKNLGKFSKSETRLVEIMEYLCKKKLLDDDTQRQFNDVKQVEFKCQQLVEENEEEIENWYFHKQSSDPDMSAWLCHDKLSLCCSPGRYGKECKTCPGVEKHLPVCFGRGSCNGDGSREGTGKCNCDKGYVGWMCSNCDSGFFAVTHTAESIECRECHKACTGGCSQDGPGGCTQCRHGWHMTEEDGCKDVNECEEEGRCVEEHSVCVNTEGSFECRCERDFVKDEHGACVLDVQAPPERMFLPPDKMLRAIALSGLCVLLTTVLWRRSLGLFIFAAICLLIAIYIELRVNHDTVPQLSRNIF